MDAGTVASSPGIFTLPINSGMPFAYAAAVNEDGTINSEQNPAPRGSVISLYSTGLGSLSRAPADGTITGLPLETQALTIEVEIPNPDFHNPFPLIGPPDWAGQAPFEIAGLSQVNVRVPYSASQFTLRVSQPGVSNSYSCSNTVLVWVR